MRKHILDNIDQWPRQNDHKRGTTQMDYIRCYHIESMPFNFQLETVYYNL